MRRMGIFGIYFPFAGEGFLDPSFIHGKNLYGWPHEWAPMDLGLQMRERQFPGLAGVFQKAEILI